jgi:hypothetical protein
MSDYTIDVNQDGVIDAQDDLDRDGDTDELDVAQQKVVDGVENPEEEEGDEAAEYLKRFGVTQGYVAPTRGTFSSSPTLDQPFTPYSGPSLLDPNNLQRGTDIAGNILPSGTYQTVYDLANDSVKLLEQLDFSQRKELTDFLYAKGLYNGQKPSSTRFDKNEFAAVGRLLRISNQAGRTYDWAINWVANNLKTVYGGPKIGAVTPFENREKVLDTEAVDILGRKLTNAELREAAEMIAQRERSNDKTNLSVMAEKAVSKQNPELESANRFAKGVDIFRSMLGTG